MDNARGHVILYLKSQIDRLNGEMSEAVKTAYDIAGLMATKYAQSLDASDPIDEFFTIAGELEVNPVNADELRTELINKISLLK